MLPTRLHLREGKFSATFIVFALYTCLLFALLPLQSLWLDELMQTAASRYLPFRALLTQEIPRTAGQVPLAYLVQRLSIHLLGFSTFSARLPAAVMSILACLALYHIMKWANTGHVWLCVALFATLPLQLRYATEARPYSQALCISVWLTVTFLQLSESKSQHYKLVLIYGVLCVLGLYTQPYTLFVAAAHICYALFEATVTKRFRVLRSLLAATACAVLLFVPWFLYARSGWRNDVNGSDLHFHMHAKLPLEILREITGAGYIEASLIFFLSTYALRSSVLTRSNKWFLALLAIVPGALALFADATSDYFFAIRQIIFVLPPLVVLTTIGLGALARNGRLRTAILLATILLALNAIYSIRWFTKPREDWGAAAAKLDRARNSGACLVLLPDGSARFYDFYVPGIANAACNPADLSRAKTIYVAVSPYLRDTTREKALRQHLQSNGFTVTSEDSSHEPHISTYERRAKTRGSRHGPVGYQ